MQKFLNVLASLFFTGLLVYLGLIAWANRYDIASILLFFIFLFFIDFILAFTVFVSDRPPNVKTSWILVILVIPFIGAVMFSIFGISPLTKKNRTQYLKEQNRFTQLESFSYTERFLQSKDRGIVHSAFEYTYRTARRPVYAHNEVRLLTEGLEFQEEALAAIRTATSFIHVQYYIVHKGSFFEKFSSELISKAKKGVEIRFLYDWVGSLNKIDRSRLRKMRAAGITVAVFNLSRNPIQGGTNFRSHRKVLIVDNLVAITGGCNLGDEYLSKDHKFGYWRDTNVFIKGEAVNTLNLLFASDWERYTKHSLRKKEKKILVDNASKYFTPQSGNSSALCQVIDSGPDYREKPIKDLLLRLIGSAKKRIWLTTPYLLPTSDIVEALRTAAFAGVDVRIVTPGRADNKRAVLAMTRSQQYDLLEAGAKFYEFQSFIHAKTALFDDEITLVGTFNLDFRSFFINFELAVMIGSRETNRQMAAIFEQDFSNSRVIDLQNYERHSLLYRKMYIGTLSIFYPLL